MFNRAPALAAGAAVAALVGGGITYATADDSGTETRQAAAVRKITKSISRSGVIVEENADLNYSIIGSLAKCPSGTQLTGGGFSDFTDGLTFMSNPDSEGKEHWYGFTFASYGENPRDFVVTATCYGPAGNFPNNAYRESGSVPRSETIPAAVLERVTKRAPR